MVVALGKTAFIIGANRGIGWQFVHTLLDRNYTVWATHRPQSAATESLRSTSAKTFEVDYLDKASIKSATKVIPNASGGWMCS
ncbi:hypothetical protein CC86DRAFT_404725 [Ophiobolus disseminans]|uniref:NAD(P)-binding protein n=1 Tax=Ophiobolus disseminans TaxID=1469910 RepID=A0A6A7A8B5_9PLEO|nr:hypothetical protein CC86DRAFT_404725 [Ophiobolus disseminans]